MNIGVYVGDHHAVDIQGHIVESQIYENIYKCGIVEYKSRHVTMSVLKRKSNV